MTRTICTGRENALYENSEVAPKLYENSEVALKANTADRPDNHVDQASPAVNNNAYQIIKPALNMKAEQTETDEEMSTNACNIVQGFSSSSSLSDDHIYGNQELLGRPIPIDELSSYVEEMCKRKDGFREEHVVSCLTFHSFMHYEFILIDTKHTLLIYAVLNSCYENINIVA